MDTEGTLILEELALLKAREDAEEYMLSLGAGLVLECSSQAHARGMTENEFLNPDKTEEDSFFFDLNAIRDHIKEENALGDPHDIKHILQEPESLEAAIEELKEAELWPWDFTQ
jgi:hypothetical protein